MIYVIYPIYFLHNKKYCGVLIIASDILYFTRKDLQLGLGHSQIDSTSGLMPHTFCERTSFRSEQMSKILNNLRLIYIGI